MLDFKAKLLAAGVVTEDDAKRVEKEDATKRARKAQQQSDKQERTRWKKRIAALEKAGKGEQYEAIRGWVKRTRLDPEKGLPPDAAERFHFQTFEGKISWLTLEPAVAEKIKAGDVGIIAWMSNNGLKHCTVPRDVAEDVGQLRPEWVRHLAGFEVLESPEPANAEPATEEPATEEPAAEEPATEQPADG